MDAPSGPLVLTAREIEAVLLRARGETDAAIKVRLGASGTWLSQTFRKAGLPARTRGPRRPAILVGEPADPFDADAYPADSPEPEGEGAVPPRPAHRTIDARLERLLSGRIADLETRLASNAIADPERAARALALNARTLVTLRRAAGGPLDDPSHDPLSEPPARSLSELRDQLREHLLRLQGEGGAGGSAPAAGPDGGGD